MSTLVCLECGWQGDIDDLESIVEKPRSINDFICCPDCDSTNVERLEDDDDFKQSVSEEEQQIRY